MIRLLGPDPLTDDKSIFCYFAKCLARGLANTLEESELLDVAAEVDCDLYCGLRLTHLQFAADRAAQLPYQDHLKPGDPVKVFPYVIEPDNLPLT